MQNGMSALPPKATLNAFIRMSAMSQIADLCAASTIDQSSARSSTVGGTFRPSALAVYKLIMSSNLVGCSTGISSGFEPLRIILT